ncbi:PAP2 superfamily [Longilinea arvoryzae]|uniref:PAP2 superfamily n=1 Tax=Longilinea arvoryzae TaxID=360412 RepID=A0A0S7BBN7_9CHLR|nr:phosphatase PAP2 family protein [Longilinea arvoryzae]GAP15228.1 PAP2 superfamily [Longilinea arvoryzae]
MFALTSVNLFFQNLGSWLAGPMKAFSFLGQQEFAILLLPAIYWCWDSALGFRLGFVLMLSNGLNNVLKLVFHAPRPYWINPEVKAISVESSFGLPSGHAQNAVALWGRLAAALRRKWMTWLAVFLILMIGLSRLYLGVHFLTDVLAGWLIGGLLLWLVVLLDEPVTAWLGQKPVGIQILWATVAAFMLILLSVVARLALGAWQVPDLWVTNAGLQTQGQTVEPLKLDGIFTAAGTWWGLTCGYAWFTRRYGRFDAGGAWEKRGLRFSIGLIVLIVLYAGLSRLLPQSPDGLGFTLRFLRYAALGGWVSAGAPWLFLRIKLASPYPAKSNV